MTVSCEDRLAAVRSALNAIVDPCSAALGVHAGLVDMGLVHRVQLSHGAVAIWLLPTGPGCLFLDHFEHEIETRLAELDWCTHVRVEIAESDLLWDETRLAPGIRRALSKRRRAAVRLTGVTPRGRTLG